jgi:hypothetical protein
LFNYRKRQDAVNIDFKTERLIYTKEKKKKARKIIKGRKKNKTEKKEREVKIGKKKRIKEKKEKT